MGLYDGYKLNNSTYISQYVGSLVPELKDFSTVMQKRYNDAKDTDDALVEAMGNLQHLGTEEDTTYANELKQNYMTRLMERSEREDYENMGRRTQRDARQFSSDYVPLVNRMKGMQTIQERVLQDEKIAAPETKQKILGRIQHMNRTARDPETGDFVRDASGKVKLGAIQDWAYAKDVDINKKLADFLKAKETDISQSGFGSNGQGLMTSVKRETRSPVEIARMAKEMMETDPEIKAMVERDVELATYAYTPAQMAEIANKNNVSVYDKLDRQGLSDAQIKVRLSAVGMSMDEAKSKPIDALRQRFIANGRTPEEADRAFLREETRKGLMSPHIDLVSQLLKVDRQTLEAREDPAYAARALGAALGAALAERDRGESIPILTEGEEIENIDVRNLQGKSAEANTARTNLETELQSTLGKLAGTPPPGMNKAEIQRYYNNTSALLNSTEAQARLLSKLPQKEAQDMKLALDRYRVLNNQALQASVVLDQVRGQVSVDPIYDVYRQKAIATKTKPMGKAEFTRTLQSKPSASGVGYAMFGIGGDKFEDFRNMYNQALQTKAEEMAKGKSFKTAYTALEPVSGKISKQTAALEEGVKSGHIKFKELSTGKNLNEMLTDEFGSHWGWTGKSKSDMEDDLNNPKSDANDARKNMRVRYNMERSANGKPTATVTLSNGKVKIVELSEVPPAYLNGITNEFYGNAAMMMSKKEASHFMTTATVAAGTSAMTKMNVPQLRSLNKGTYEISDMYGVRVMDAGSGSYKAKLYQLMIKDPSGNLKAANIKPTDDYQTVLGLIGQQELNMDWPADGPGVSNPTR